MPSIIASCMVTLSMARDIKAAYRFYRLQSSTAAVPSKPTSIDPLPPSGWSDTEPSYTEGSTYTLYTVDLTVFSDDTFSYSPVSISSSYEAAKQAYNKALAAENEAKLAAVASDLIVGTQTGTTAAWTGNAAFNELRDGMSILYWLPQTSAANATLNLTLANGNTTGAINLYYSGTTRVGTQYAAGNIIRLTYRHNATFGTSTTQYTGWWCDANYDSGNNYDRIRFNNTITAAAAITSGHLIVATESGYRDVATGNAFDLNKPILYAASTLAAGATGSNNYLAYPGINLQKTKSGWTGTNRATVYMPGTISGTTFTPTATLLTTTKPTSDDGLYYIAIGLMVSTTACYFFPEHPIYKFMDGEFKSISQIAYEAKLSANENASNIGSLTTQVTTNTTNITKNANAIELKAESTTVTKLREDFENLDIGARNLVLKTSESKTATCPASTTNGAYTPTYHVSEYAMALLNGAEAGDIYTVSLDWEQTGESTGGYFYVQLRNNACILPNGSTAAVYFSADNNSGHSVVPIKLKSTHITATSDYFRFRITESSGTGPATITVSNVKFEKGNKATDWSPAPEDILNEANEYTATQVAAIEVKADGISSTVTSLTETMNTLRDDQSALEDTVAGNATNANEMITALRSLIDQNAESISAAIQTMDEQGSWISQAALWLTANGLHLQTSSTSTIFNADGEGVKITKSDGTVVAEFTNSNSAVDYLKVRTHLSFGAHRGEMLDDTEFDGTTSEGTAFFWIGDVI